MSALPFKREPNPPLSAAEAKLCHAIDPERMPAHIAVIMDGNGRWAKARNYSRIKGHKAAIPAVRDTMQACFDLGIQSLTLYAFSTENWKRPPQETGTLMALLRQYLRLQMRSAKKYDIRLRAIGTISELAEGIRRDLDEAERRTAHHTGMCFNIALNYSGRQDILTAIRKAAASGVDLAKLDEAAFSSFLSTGGQPDPDLVIRTSGEHRLSNFLLWQVAYSELWVTPTLWPDFRRIHLLQAIVDFQSRNRRFGGI